MTTLFWIIVIILMTAVMGFAILILPIYAFYWGERGKPLPTDKEERKRLREEELQLRAKQIEYSKNNPIATRKGSFWDNRKVYKQK